MHIMNAALVHEDDFPSHRSTRLRPRRDLFGMTV